MLRFTIFLLAVSIFACKPQKETYYEANAKDSPTAAAPNNKPDNTVYYVFENGTYVQSELDKKPEPVGGTSAFYRTMGAAIQYPAAARQRGIQGEVILTVIVNELGQAEEVQVTKRLGAGCDEAASNAWKKAAQNGFEPAMKGGKAVKVKYDVPVKFGLP